MFCSTCHLDCILFESNDKQGFFDAIASLTQWYASNYVACPMLSMEEWKLVITNLLSPNKYDFVF